MVNRAHGLVLVLALALPLTATGQSGEARTLTGHVTITTSKTGRTAAVVVKKDAMSKDVESLFCLDLAPPGPPKIEFAGPARAIYLPQPVSGLPAGIKISGPENVSSTLAIVPAQGKGWSFVGKGEKPLLPAGDPAATSAVRVNVTVVRRVDWIGDDGQRRGTDLQGCLAPAG
jgi:hypothetical protein